MPLISSAFHPPAFLRNAHVQTILPVLLSWRSTLTFQPEQIELEDGDFLELGWARAGRSRLAIITHGLEGSASAGYIRAMATTMVAAGWDALVWNFRGCGPVLNRLLRFYHSGDTGDLRSVIAHAAAFYQKIALIGFSLGGNVTLKYLGEPSVHLSVVAAAAISTPVDLASSARKLDEHRGNRFYLDRFLRSLIAKVEAKASRFPEEINVAGARAIRTFQEFDDRYTARLHGFRDAAHYWSVSSSRPYLPQITVPTLLLNALDDPFLDTPSFPYAEAEASNALHLETPTHGGHVGFVDLRRGWQPWSEWRVAAFLNEVAAEVS